MNYEMRLKFRSKVVFNPIAQILVIFWHVLAKRRTHIALEIHQDIEQSAKLLNLLSRRKYFETWNGFVVASGFFPHYCIIFPSTPTENREAQLFE